MGIQITAAAAVAAAATVESAAAARQNSESKPSVNEPIPSGKIIDVTAAADETKAAYPKSEAGKAASAPNGVDNKQVADEDVSPTAAKPDSETTAAGKTADKGAVEPQN